MYFFCLEVNLRGIGDLNSILMDADEKTKYLNLNDKSDFIKQKLIDCANLRGIALKLRNGKW